MLWKVRAPVRLPVLLLIALPLVWASAIQAQDLPGTASFGTVTGTVVDAETGETLIGVNIWVPALQRGTTTDLDGRYQLRLEPGIHAVSFSFIGYATQTVQNVALAPGQTLVLDIALSVAAIGLDEVVVQADAILGAEAALLRLQAQAPAILDGLSAQQIRRSPDATSGEALRRVTGIQVAGGRFVFVRGLPERYNGTLLNGSVVASTEPDRRAFTYDLIPSSLLENVIIAKTATPDLPGDFAGGMLQLNTVSFPDQPSASISLGSSVNNATQTLILSGPRGTTDFLGIDDGTRALPAGFPRQNIAMAGLSDAERAELGRALFNSWGLSQRQGPVTPNFSFSAGGATDGRLGRLGVIGSVTYRSGYSATDMIRRDFEGPDQLRFDYSGSQYIYNVTWGGLLNLTYRPGPFHSLSLKNFYSRHADDEVTQLSGVQYTDAGAEQQRTLMRFLSRDVYSVQLIGEHAFPALVRGLQVRWDLARSFTTRDEPDHRSIIYQRSLAAGPEEPFSAVVGSTISPHTGGRFFSYLEEGTWSGGARAVLPLGALRLTGGAAVVRTARHFDSRLLAATQPSNLALRRHFDGSLLLLPLDQIFRPENFGRLDRPGCENGGPRCQGFILNESHVGGSDYDAWQDQSAGFLMFDVPLRFIAPRLRVVGGARLEHTVQRLQSMIRAGDSLDVRSPYTNLLPSINLTYGLLENANLRLAYSRTVNRPELRELAPFSYYDFELQTTTYGNPGLRQATIDNLDFRLELFPGPGQLLSFSAFYKHFDHPIERAIVPGVARNAERTFTNANVARNYGVEIEGRHGLGFLTPLLAASSALFNFTWVHSEVTIEASEMTIARTGRPLQGQAPYIVNLGLHLVAPSTGSQLALLFHQIGRRVTEVATAFEDDVFEESRPLFDLSFTQPILDRYELRIAIRDVLNQPQVFTQAGELVRENHRGRSFSFGLSARF